MDPDGASPQDTTARVDVCSCCAAYVVGWNKGKDGIVLLAASSTGPRTVQCMGMTLWDNDSAQRSAMHLLQNFANKRSVQPVHQQNWFVQIRDTRQCIAVIMLVSNLDAACGRIA